MSEASRIEKEQEKLLADWQKHERKFHEERFKKSVREHNFVLDGVGNIESYLASKPKILVALREPHGDPYGEAHGRWDLRDILRDGNSVGGRTWNAVAEWVAGIRYSNEDLTLDEWYKKVWSPERGSGALEAKQHLSSIAAINLKKFSGESGIGWNFGPTVEENMHLIERQIGIYNPDIIVWTAWDMMEKLSFCKGMEPKKIRDDGGGDPVAYIEYESGKFILSFRHPARSKHEDSHDLYQAVRRIREDRKPDW